jgi:D-3-phosphoglycerate dehydrogenase
MISGDQIAQMKKGSCLINASRGDVVDYKAVAEGLRSKHLAGVAADVFPKEPSSNDKPFENDLQDFNNVILTPHIAGSTLEALANIGLEVAEKLVRYSDTGSTIGAVNFVEIALQANSSKQRFLHIHKNVPGVLGEINHYFSSRVSIFQLNTCRPMLTWVMLSWKLIVNLMIQSLQDLKNIPHTIRVRILY